MSGAIVVDFRGDMTLALKRVDNLQDAVKGRALARTLNRVATTVRAEARKEIRARYNIAAARVNQILRIRQATPSSLDAAVYAKDRRLALAVFGATERRGEVTVKVLRAGARRTVKGDPRQLGKPFLQRVGGGRHLGIFQRVGRSRLPLRELFTISIPGALTSKLIGGALRKVAQKRFPIEFERELRFRTRRAA